MNINGIDEALDPNHDDERWRITVALTEGVERRLGLDHATAALAAATTIDLLFAELSNAASYVWLRTEICKTMADPDSWDGDEPEENVLARYVQHLALASHGDCESCGRRIPAAELFEPVDCVGNSVWMGSPATRAIYCAGCV